MKFQSFTEWGSALLIFTAITLTASCSFSHKIPGAVVMKTEAGAATTAPVNYVALGDSTGVGVGARQGGGYVARLFERIKHDRPQSVLANMCVSGATTEDVLRSQVDAGLAKNPTLITLGIGVNDIGHGFSEERFSRNYEEILRRVRARTDAPIIITNIPDVSLAPVVPAYMRQNLNAQVLSFNERIKEMAERYNLTVVDAYTPTHELIPSHPEFFSADGFHPSDVGYEYWAKMMWPTVKSAIGE